MEEETLKIINEKIRKILSNEKIRKILSEENDMNFYKAIDLIKALNNPLDGM